MNYSNIPLAQQIVQLCEKKGVKHVVISPGSRNAPLTISFSSHPNINTYSVVDERCAAFFALGMAQQLQQPIAVVCTSGSAMLNYHPAVAEAFYSQIPLVVISADRPQHLIGIGDGQTIYQENIFGKHVLYSANLSEHSKQNQIDINTAINTAKGHNGPVHINVPFAEPLYETQPEMTEAITVIPEEVSDYSIDESAYADFTQQWNTSHKRMVLIGVNTPNNIEQDVLEYLANDKATIVLTESTSNVHHENFCSSIDKYIAPLDSEDFQKLRPETLVTIGGLVVSKKVKKFLRTYQPEAHFHVGTCKALDTYFCLQHHFKLNETHFFKRLMADALPVNSSYQTQWLSIKTHRAIQHDAYLKTIPFSDFKAFESILKAIPEHSVLHLSNSSTIRYVQLFNQNPSVIQYCNRGTSGIDGSTSTAIGHAAVSAQQNILITGDLSFFYDSNALWNNYMPKSFRIIVINNSGGGIFRILPGQKNTENFETYFETTHNLTAEYLCQMYGMSYKAVSNAADLQSELSCFFLDDEKPALLEIFTPRTTNDDVLLQYFEFMRNNA
ncbi:MAG: 2-succinyl-5-enolpyruvyl-6-hydroxy-3-cyclohexene-1-carboxylic-acid synthase [Flavobacteriaceae bacterium]